MKRNVIIALLIFAIIASFFLGANLSKIGIARSVKQLQAELSFHHLHAYSDLQSDFLSGCRSRVESRLEHIIDEQKMQMAEYVQNVSDKKFEDYITLRDRDLIEELRTYKVNWKKTVTLPECKSNNTKKLKGMKKGK